LVYMRVTKKQMKFDKKQMKFDKILIAHPS
jgi:hypothetical protein